MNHHEVPLFHQIDQEGDPQKPIGEKIEIAGRGSDLLADLGVNKELVDSVRDYEQRLLPLNTLVLAREPVGAERQREGRGDYHEVPIGNKKGILYVKGTGSVDMFKGTDKPFPAFPGTQEDLFFDGLLFNHHPRMHGTETLTWGILELINAATVFSELSQKYGWKSVEDAMNDGVTIPMSIMHYKELSEYLQGLLRTSIQNSQDKLDLKAMNWKGNFYGHGSVSLLVPSDQRVFGGIRDSEGEDTKIQRLVDPEIAKVVGRTMREMMEMGFVYSINSSHGQNLYKEGFVAQADNSDLVVLGDYKGNPNFSWSNKIITPLSAGLQRAHLIFMQLNRPSLLTPLHMPAPDAKISWESVEGIQKMYWLEILQDISQTPNKETQTIDLAKLMPFLRTEINLATAFLIVDSSDQLRWEHIAKKRRNLLDRFEAYGVPQEYEQKLKDNYHIHESETYQIRDIMINNRLPLNELMEFIKTGDIHVLERHPYSKKMLQLSQTIYTIDSVQDRDTILHKVGTYFGLRDIGYPFLKEGDIIAQFNNDHLDVIIQLLKEKRFSDVVKVIDILAMLSEGWFDQWYSLKEDKLEKPSYRYGLELIVHDDINDIFERCQFEYALRSLSGATVPFRLDLMARELLNTGKIQQKNLDINTYADTNNLPRPREIIAKAIGTLVEDNPVKRKQITEWIRTYQETLMLLDTIDNQGTTTTVDLDTEQVRLMSELELLTDQIRTLYPELGLAHDILMSDFLREKDAVHASEYFDRVLDYYKTVFPNRKGEIGVSEWGFNDVEIVQSCHIFEPKYRQLGYTMIANYYLELITVGYSMKSIW